MKSIEITGIGRTALALGVLGILGLSTTTAWAQTALNWQTMREVVFNSEKFSSTGTAADRALLAQIWATQLKALDAKSKNGKYPAFTLIADVNVDSKRFVLSFFDAAGSEHCLDAANGRGAVDIYVVCDLRVSWLDGSTAHSRFVANHCMLRGDNKDTPRSKNHVEYAVDTRAKTVYLRTIQYGKVVPLCSRALKLA